MLRVPYSGFYLLGPDKINLLIQGNVFNTTWKILYLIESPHAVMHR